ncbi:MAG: hypothetical protein E7604_01335 [Ruminococcaceae bacterium]|nr:hypothetical protein [Oscillospiraceae bacterium]
MMTAVVGAYDIATEHAILAEASDAGAWSAVPQALLFGVFLGAVYSLFRIPAAMLGVCEDGMHPDNRMGKWMLRLRQCRCRSVRNGQTKAADRHDTGRSSHPVPAQVMQCILDLLYFLVCGVLGAVFLYWRNDGILRWYLVLAGSIGFFAYSRTVGVLVMRTMALVLALVHAALCTLWNLTLYYLLRLGYLAGAALIHRIAGGIRQLAARFHRKNKTQTEQQKRNRTLWQRNRNSQRKKPVSSRRSHCSSSSDSVPSPSFSSMVRSRNTRKKLP